MIYTCCCKYSWFKVFLYSILLLSISDLKAEEQLYHKSFLTVRNGLSQNEVTSIVQDKYGFMWFGTNGGLNRFDGYSFKQFKPSFNNKKGLKNPSIESLLSDEKGNIWVGTKSGGTAIYDQRQECFSLAYNKNEYVHNRVIALYEDEYQNKWVGQWQHGLIKISPEGDLHEKILVNNRANAILKSPDGTLWVGSDDGVKYKRKNSHEFKSLLNEEITDIVLDPDGPFIWLIGWTQNLIRLNYNDLTYKEYPNSLIPKNHRHKSYSLLTDNSGNIWIGTWGRGLYKFNKKSKKFSKVNIYPNTRLTPNVGYDVILDIYKDKVGDIWVGTQAGIVKLSPKSNFNYLEVFGQDLLKRPHVSAVLIDSNKNKWIGTKGNGLYISRVNQKKLIKVRFNKSSKYYHRQEIVVKNIIEDCDSNIWVSLNEGVFIAHKLYSNNYELISASDFFSSPDLTIIKKAHGLLWDNDKLWVGTQQEGVYLFGLINGKYKYLKNYQGGYNKGYIGDNRVTTIKKDAKGNLFFGTYNGLFALNKSDSSFISLDEVLPENNKLLSDIVLSMHIDRDNHIWFGSPCGLNKLEYTTKNDVKVTTYTTDKGLTDDYINGILDDESGNIWITTNAGLSVINKQTGEVRNYDENDGIGEASFSEGASFKGKDGTLYFGGYSSFTYFHPSEIQENNTKPHLVITKFNILNKEVPIEEEGVLTQNINETDKIKLSYKESEFSVEFASLDYKAPKKNLYAYKLKGYNDSWINIGNRRHISFSNLSSGKYTLLLRGTNSNGIWNNNIKSIDIEVLPAPWKSIYAIVFYVIIVMGVVLLISWIGVRQERLENNIKLVKLQREQAQELNEYKLKFFTNISHELRTPLTLILAPVKDLLKKDISTISPNYFQDKIQLIYQNTSRLYGLVNQLLEFRKIEADKVRLNVTKNDVNNFAQQICKPFKELTSLHQISFQFQSKVQNTALYFDQERIGIVVNNLLSNAVKYAGKQGSVKLALYEKQYSVCLDVINYGQVIPKNELDLLFERFYQTKGNQSIESSGIGLELVKSYTEMHHGNISVISEEDKGTIFTVELKKGKEHFKKEQLSTSKDEIILPEPGVALSKAKTINVGTKGAKVLIVEDNPDVRMYLMSLLSENYQVFDAEDGLAGLEKAVELKPNIIISDVMMPRMDGYEFCEKIKSNDLLAHIPIILLTAKITDNDMIFGTRKGAEVYLKKPFDPELLLEKVRLLISTTKRLEEKYSQKVVLEPKDAEITKEEGVFLTKAIKVVENNISNQHFDPEHLAKEMAMSTSTFYRKLKKVSQQSPGEFIKSLRLKRAAQLLIDSDLTVSEIIENIGYLDIRNFRKNFKDTYGDTPVNYRKAERQRLQSEIG